MLPIIAGYVFRKVKYFPEKHGTAVRLLVIRITIPAMIFTHLYQADLRTLGQFIPLSAGLFIFCFLTWGISLLVTKWKGFRDRRMENILMILFSNVGFIGWAVLDTILGEEGLRRGIFFTTFFWVAQYLFGFLTYKVTQKGNEEHKLEGLGANVLPVFATVGLGLFLNLMQWQIPPVLYDFVDKFGKMTVPLILFTMGMTISLKHSFSNLKELLPLVLFRHIIIAATMAITILALPMLDEISVKVLIIEALMPIAAGVIIIGDIFKNDMEYISSATALSTILAFVTIPAMILLF